jgi:tetratricopeptide (TPR) repeat protein
VSSCRCSSLAGSGKLTEAVSLLSQQTVRAAWPEWLYLSLLAGIHDTARDFDRAIALNREALSVSGARPSLLVDLAFRLAFRKRDFSSARSAIEEAEKRDLIDLAKPFLSRCRGLISEGHGDLDEARKHLEEALRGLTGFSQLDLMEGNIHLTEAFLCCVCARLGDATSAAHYLQRSRDYLLAAHEAELLRRCEEAIRSRSK